MIFIALPSYDGTRYNAATYVEFAKSIEDTCLGENTCSLITKNFNQCWAEALNRRTTHKITKFIMLHADVIPTQSFLKKFLDEQKRVNAEVLSVVMPIKSNEGLTSTALETDDIWCPRRLTMTEIYERPETWTDPNLLINTGLFVVDFTKPWVENIVFTINDTIRKNSAGKFEALTESEGWNFSRQLHKLGVKPWVTRKVSAIHVGTSYYGNDKPWGKYTKDPCIKGE